MLICETIKQTAITCPNKIAIICDREKMTYRELNETIHCLQQQLTTVLGPLNKKKIAFLIENERPFLTLFLAIIQAGAIAIPLDPKWSQVDKQHIVADCSPDLLISEHEFTGTLILSLDELTNQNVTGLPDQNISDKHHFYIGYTSGTTGKPKGFLRTHSSWIHSFTASDLVFDINKEDVIFAPGPLVHSHFLYAALHGLHKGATIYITKKFRADSVYRTLSTDPITILYLVPTMFSALTFEFKENKKQILSLKKVISAGAKWKPILKEKSKFLIPNAEVFEFYGASELSLVSVLDEVGNIEKPESVGRAVPGVDVSIRRSDGTEANTREVGKLFIKSKFLFSGYLNLPEATREVFYDNWATIGDLAFIDEHGFITLVGREKNMIISGGLNIYPEEVEKVLSTIHEIEEVVVIGLDDAYWGEKLVAVIKFHEGKHLSIEQIKQHCKQKLATYKCPQQMVELESFPYTTSQKIARKELLRIVQTQIEQQRT